MDDATEPDLSLFGELDYAPGYAADLCTALETAGYEAKLIADPGRLSAGELGEQVERYLVDGEVAVVHVLSHGEYTKDGGVYVVGSDATRSKRTRVEDWRIAVTDDQTAPTTLFLLDLCHAGAANRHWQPPAAGSREKAWVIAAAEADQQAFAGRLTRAATAVITEITSGCADLAETLPFVGFDVLFERIRRQVRQLALDEGGYLQDPVCTPVMGAQPELPFFRNPAYQPSAAAEAAAAVDPATAGFVDPALDEEHFRDRAAGRGPATARIAGGCFTGRGPQLRRLADWMDGHDDPIDPEGKGDGPVVVTGSPGVGKSALLGVLVCAAHPQLRETTRELWWHAAARPSLNLHLAAVHARQRSLEEITASLGRQLFGSDGGLYPGPTLFPGEQAVPAGPGAPEELIAAIADQQVRPVIVLDALDEARGHQQILDRLLVPLARAHRPDGSPACRLLIGTRPWDEFAPLLKLADETGELIDLDAIPPEQRREDLADYVNSLLELLPGYTGTAHRVGRRAFATALAATLIPGQQAVRAPETTTTGRSEPGGTRWGEFLVAALYTHTATLNHPDQLADPEAAARLGAAAPRTLPEVLELDLATRPPSPWRRPLLTGLAHARGAGIPRAVLPAVIAAVAGRSVPPSIEQVADELEQLRFYLRTGTDTDGAALYRLFHQSMAEQLRASPDPAANDERILDGLLATVPSDDQGRRRWDLAAPYQLRHTLQHAADAARVDELLTDAGFLIHADPTTLIPSLDLAIGPDARLAAAVYRASAGQHLDKTPIQRRDVLAIDAARYGAYQLRDALCAVPPEARWRPRWSTGGQVNTALHATITTRTNSAAALACTVVDGRPVAVTAGWDRTVRVWDLTTRTPIGDPLTGHTDDMTAVACTVVDGRPVAVTTSLDGTVRVWDLSTRTLIGDPLTSDTSTGSAVACTILDGRPVAVTTSWDGTVRVWDLSTRTLIGDPLTGHTHTGFAVACTVLDGRPIAVTTGRDVRLWDLTTRTPIGDPLTGHTDLVAAVACTVVDGRPVAVTTSLDNTVRVWDLSTRTPIGDPLTGHTNTVTAVACAILDGRPVAITTSWDHTVRVWDLTTRTPIGDPLTGHTHFVAAVACTVLNGRPIAVTTSRDDTVRVWDLMSTRALIGDPLTGHTNTVTAVACTILDGRPVAITTSWDHTVRVWDLTTRTPIGDPLTGTAVSCTVLDGRPVAIITSWDRTVRVWDLSTRTPIGDPLTSHAANTMTAVSCTVLDGRPIAVTTSQDDTVRVWDLTTRTPIGDPLTGHTDFVAAVACTVLNGRPIAVTTSQDNTVRVWDLTTRTPIGDPLTGHTGLVWAVACTVLDDRPVAVTAGWDPAVRIWDVREGRELERIDLPAPVWPIDVGLGNVVVAGFGWDVVVLEPASGGRG